MEHICNDKLVQLDKTQNMNLGFCQYLDSLNIWNLSAPSIGYQTLFQIFLRYQIEFNTIFWHKISIPNYCCP